MGGTLPSMMSYTLGTLDKMLTVRQNIKTMGNYCLRMEVNKK